MLLFAATFAGSPFRDGGQTGRPAWALRRIIGEGRRGFDHWVDANAGVAGSRGKRRHDAEDHAAHILDDEAEEVERGLGRADLAAPHEDDSLVAVIRPERVHDRLEVRRPRRLPSPRLGESEERTRCRSAHSLTLIAGSAVRPARHAASTKVVVSSIGEFPLVRVNAPPPERRWLRVTAQSRISPPFGGILLALSWSPGSIAAGFLRSA